MKLLPTEVLSHQVPGTGCFCVFVFVAEAILAGGLYVNNTRGLPMWDSIRRCWIALFVILSRVHNDSSGSDWLYEYTSRQRSISLALTIPSRTHCNVSVLNFTKCVRRAALCVSTACVSTGCAPLSITPLFCSHVPCLSFRCARSWKRSMEFPSDDDGEQFDSCTPVCNGSCARHALCGGGGMRVEVSVVVCFLYAHVGARSHCVQTCRTDCIVGIDLEASRVLYCC